ncbi:MAG: AMP-binding protein, partial [Niveispirillum sp.]|nr:AMP-binding protein [Niveispirillum sp.]
TPDRPALAHGGGFVTYGTLNSRADRLARQLSALGVGPDIPVGLHLDPGFDMIIGLLGVLKAGGAYLPLVPGTAPDRLAYIVDQARVPHILSQANLPSGVATGGAQVHVLEQLLAKVAAGKTPTRTVRPDQLAYI